MSISARFAPLFAASRLPLFNAPRQRVLDAFALAVFDRKYSPAVAAESAGRPPSVLPFDSDRLSSIARQYRFNPIHFFEASKLLSDNAAGSILSVVRDASLAVAAAYRKHLGHSASSDGLLECMAIATSLAHMGQQSRIVLTRRTMPTDPSMDEGALVALVLFDQYLIDPSIAGSALTPLRPDGLLLRNHSSRFGDWLNFDLRGAIEGTSIRWRWKTELPIVESFLADTPHDQDHLRLVLQSAGFAASRDAYTYEDIVMSLVRTDMITPPSAGRFHQSLSGVSGKSPFVATLQSEYHDSSRPTIALRTVEGVRLAFIKHSRSEGEAISIPTHIHRYTGGFEWGYAGSGPQALSAAIAARVFPEFDSAAVRSAATLILEVIRNLDPDQDSHDISVDAIRSIALDAGFDVTPIFQH
jgi:hypothetical protein